jgi:phosphatidylinositol 3-kinase
MALPLDPQIQVTGIVPERASIFKSALSPLFLTFTRIDGSEYSVIFKTGDDLRQDQLVVQIISLMDRLLRKENLDLHLTPYKVLATGMDHGMLQFIPSKTVASILAENGNSMIPFFSKDLSSLEIEKSVMDTYVRSTGKES